MRSSQMEQQADNVAEDKSSETSLLFERYTIWFLLGLIVIGIWYKTLPLIIVTTFLIILYFLVTVWKTKALLHVKPMLQLSKSRLFAGQEFSVQAEIFNNKWLPLVWIEWEFSNNKAIIWGENEQQTYLIRFLWVQWFQRVKWTLKGKALKRGVYNVGHVSLRSGDGFRFTEKVNFYSLDGQLYVYPKLLPVRVIPIHHSFQLGVNAKQGGLLEDPILINGIREYQPGDELRRFNWRASARTGKLQTNVFQPIVSEQLLVFLDVEGFVVNQNLYEDEKEMEEYAIKKNESFEWYLSIISSYIINCNKQGINVGFASNALTYLEKKTRNIPPSTNITALLDEIASMTQRVGIKTVNILNQLLVDGKLSCPLFIFCAEVTNEHFSWYEKNRHKLGGVQFYYMKQTEHAIKLGPSAKSLDTLLISPSS